MPDSGAVYQPTTVGYSYDTGVGGFLGVGSVSRHKVSIKKWLEWALLSAAVSIFAAGLLVTIIDLASIDYSEAKDDQDVKPIIEASGTNGTQTTINEGSDPSLVHKDQDGGDNSSGRTIAVGVTLVVVGLILGLLWGWLRFFRRNESPRNEPSGGGGQMLGGLNPSTDLLVGSPSQYGPVLTEVPSHPKIKQATNHQVAASTLSDQEEETRTLMQEPPSFSPSCNNAAENQHPG